MSYQKIANLAEKLYQKTQNNLLEWEGTEKEGVYQVSFLNYSVRIFERPNYDHYPNEESVIDYVIQILNSNGEIIEETSDVDLKPLWDDSFICMKHIYETARRKVMGVEDALDSILQELDDEIPDDEIPF